MTKSLIGIIDDDSEVRESLALLLAHHGYTVRGFDCAETFINAYPPILADCLLVDVRMPGMSGLELQELLARSNSSVAVIIMTGHGDVAVAVRAMKLGAMDFIEKPFLDKRVIDAVDTALSRTAKTRLVEQEALEAGRLVARLSDREREILALLADGRSNKLIARDLGISPRTVETYRASMMYKLEADSPSEAIRIALKAQHRPLPQHTMRLVEPGP